MPIGNSDFARDFQIGASVARMAQQRQERMIELRAQAAQQALLERQIVQELQIKTEQFKQQQAIKTHVDSVFAAAADTYNQLAPEIGEEAAKEFIDRGVQYDQYAGPVMMKIREAESQMRMNQAHAKAYEADATSPGGVQFTPTVVQPIDQTTGRPALDASGKPLRMVTTGKGSAAPLEKAPNDVIGFLLEKQRAAVNSGDKEAADAYKLALAKETLSSGMRLVTHQDGTLELVQGQMVNDPDTLTKTNQSRAQEAQSKALETIDTAERLMPLLTTETVGLEAFAKYWIKDRVLAQRFPGLASKERAQASQLVAKLRSTAVGDLKSDGNISDKERNEILDSFPKANDPIDSPARAKMVVEQTQVTAAIHALLQAKRLNGEIPKAAAMVLDDENVAEMVNRGTITSDLAQKIWKMKRQ